MVLALCTGTWLNPLIGLSEAYVQIFPTYSLSFRVIIYRYKFLTEDEYDNRFITSDFIDIDKTRAEFRMETLLPLETREKRKYIKVMKTNSKKKLFCYIYSILQIDYRGLFFNTNHYFPFIEKTGDVIATGARRKNPTFFIVYFPNVCNV